MGNISSFMLCFALFGCLLGCSDSNIKLVQESVFHNNSLINVKDTTDLIFSDTNWKSFKDDGKNKVMFVGKITKDTHGAMVEKFSHTITVASVPELGENFDKGIKPYEAKIQEVSDTLGKEYGRLHSECTDFRQRMRIPQLGEEERVCAELETAQEKYSSAYKSAEKERDEARRKMEIELTEILQRKYLFPVGSEVQFTWIILPNGKDFILDTVTCETLKGEACNTILVMALGKSMH